MTFISMKNDDLQWKISNIFNVCCENMGYVFQQLFVSVWDLTDPGGLALNTFSILQESVCSTRELELKWI